MDEWDSDHRDDEGPQPADLDELGGDETTDTVPCPFCGAAIYEDADRCPHCDRYVTPGRGRHVASRWWFWAAVLLALTAMMLFLLALD